MGVCLTLILGGVRSGKSTYAQRRAQEAGGKVLFVATASASDEEMAARIRAHREDRPRDWETLEVLREAGRQIEEVDPSPDIVVVDCLTLLAGRMLLDLKGPIDSSRACAALAGELDSLLAAYHHSRARWFLVSNEVGMGIVPETILGRVYRDALGWANQRLAEVADEVVLLVTGLPLWLKNPALPGAREASDERVSPSG
jgi:adenosylcobinamide kinase/adenosylcobinamide-phosphate guanylyltransferase